MDTPMDVSSGAEPQQNTPASPPPSKGLDLSAGMVPNAPAPSGLDLSAGMIPTPAPAAVPDSLHMQDDMGIQPGDSRLTQMGKNAMDFAKHANAVGAGIGGGILDTIGGGLHILNRVDQAAGIHSNMLHSAEDSINRSNQQLSQQNSENPGLNTAGHVVENVAEFAGGEGAFKAAAKVLMADKALQGLSLAEKL
jgi:hypothetical protein